MFDMFKNERSKYEKFMKEYNSDHECCPKCGSDSQRQTYMGYVYSPDREYKDENRAVCECGWTGIVHDLVSAESWNDLPSIHAE